MNNEISVGDIKFWEHENIIYCEIYSGFDENNTNGEIEEIFLSAISILSNGKYKPILINLRKTNFALSFKMFKFLSKNFHIKTKVLSKTFLVNSYGLKALLFIYNFATFPIVPNTIFTDYNSAIIDCNENYMLFNPLRFH